MNQRLLEKIEAKVTLLLQVHAKNNHAKWEVELLGSGDENKLFPPSPKLNPLIEQKD